MNTEIYNALEKGELIIFLGAGASFNSRTSTGQKVPLGNGLAKQLCEDIDIEYNNESLKKVYQVYKKKQGESRLQEFLEKIFKNCRYSDAYKKLSILPLKRIYTLNIDDCTENAFRDNRRRVDIKSRQDSINEYSYNDEICTLIKLNGDINNPESSYIFSSSEYASDIVSQTNWYKELAQDMHNYTFVFIGTQLNEPLLEYHLELFKRENNVSSSKSYLVTPNASEIEVESLKEFNIEYINGTFEQFVNEITNHYGDNIPTYKDIAKKLYPYSIFDDADIDILNRITPINKLQKFSKNKENKRKVSSFYKGFKPSWQEIIDGIPAKLTKTELFFHENFSKPLSKNSIFVIVGNAGSGKSTAIKQLAYDISNTGNNEVYFLENDYESLEKTLKYLDKINDKSFYVCIDRILNNRYHEIIELINEGKTQASFILTENIALWESKAQSILQEHTDAILNLSTIENEDADKILEKIKAYGNWTRLSKLSKSDRKKELLSKAKKQLLIGLLEVTSGFGYDEIIQKDFNSIESKDGKNLLILTSIPALENLPANYQTIEKALRELNPDFTSNINSLKQETIGTLIFDKNKIVTRHRVYSQKIFDTNLENSTILLYVKAYINSFTNYQFPIVQNISKSESSVYKQLVNFKFLKKLFKDDEIPIINIYDSFEKKLEQDGLFLLQYGLALRHFKKPLDSYQKLKFASYAYPDSPHIEHALAQQKLILSASTEDYGINREKLFDEAKEALVKLSKVEIGSFRNDRYPIVTLSRGHINYAKNNQDIESAKKIARDYFNKIQKFPEATTDKYLKDISTELMLFSIHGTWSREISDWNF